MGARAEPRERGEESEGGRFHGAKRGRLVRHAGELEQPDEPEQDRGKPGRGHHIIASRPSSFPLQNFAQADLNGRRRVTSAHRLHWLAVGSIRLMVFDTSMPSIE